MNLTPKDNPQEFNKVLFQEIGINLFKHKYLKDYIDGVQSGIRKLYDASLINKTGDGWILILHGDILLIYGHNWNKAQFSEIKQIFDLNDYTNYAAGGEAKLIGELIEYFKVDKYTVRKERIFYKSDKIIDFETNGLKIELGKMSELNELAIMLQLYYHEEYKGENDKSLSEMQQRMFQLIHTAKVYTLKNKSNNLLSFCSIIDPDIGILFTNPEHREKGYGKILLSHCSKLLENENGAVYVMTDRNEVGSNRVCKAVGFNSIYEFSMIEINYG
ncbi:GNAT family N-acetyltransferase [Aestuariibaculum sediminum]|uniref:GNAT family N-acetyltransferase n=1 Tax=Aestuariibaculum sediminum TaxID=2770637 RepID=A0A8J6U8J5_9FLAO|nr:GNAT family N-acetyltransferase [Aestuariibaculum sediminum]MBD0833340.1 GNAT family N-acetyltransferase [Aestuariibaculum sediminum]